MPNDQEIQNALKQAAEKLLKRPLTPAETSRLLESFKKQSGTGAERALEALTESTGLPRHMVKSATTDNTDRTMKDLNDVITNWRP